MESTDIVDQGVTVSEGLLLNREREAVKYITGYSSIGKTHLGRKVCCVVLGHLQNKKTKPELTLHWNTIKADAPVMRCFWVIKQPRTSNKSKNLSGNTGSSTMDGYKRCELLNATKRCHSTDGVNRKNTSVPVDVTHRDWRGVRR